MDDGREISVSLHDLAPHPNIFIERSKNNAVTNDVDVLVYVPNMQNYVNVQQIVNHVVSETGGSYATDHVSETSIQDDCQPQLRRSSRICRRDNRCGDNIYSDEESAFALGLIVVRFEPPFTALLLLGSLLVIGSPKTS